MIKAAALQLVQNLEKDLGLYRARREADFYLHGQPNPKSSRTSRRASVLQWIMGDRIPERQPRFKMRTFTPVNCKWTNDTKTTPPTNHLASAGNHPKEAKIGRDRVFFEDIQAADPPVRKRQRSSRSNNGLLHQAPPLLALPSEVSEVNKPGPASSPVSAPTSQAQEN